MKSQHRRATGVLAILAGALLLLQAARVARAENSPFCDSSLEVEPIPGIANPNPTHADNWRPKGGDPYAAAPWTCVTKTCAKSCKIGMVVGGLSMRWRKCGCPDMDAAAPGDQAEAYNQFCSIAISFTQSSQGGVTFIGNVQCVCVPTASCVGAAQCKFSVTTVQVGETTKQYADCNCQ